MGRFGNLPTTPSLNLSFFDAGAIVPRCMAGDGCICQQRRGPRMTNRLRAEAPTWAALLICYGLYAALTVSAPEIPFGLGYVALAFVIAFHSSLQHEAIHGHPTRSPLLNEALVFPPLGLAFPYRRYRDTHLAHHIDNRLTDPYDDPESWYLDPAAWDRASRLLKSILIANNTALGRMLIGPGLGFIRFIIAEMRLVTGGDRKVMRGWSLHLLGAAPVIWWVWYSGLSAAGYGLACYFGLSLINLRSFLEHRAEERVSGRSVIVEDYGPLALLYLNNNFHAVHHAHPDMPWAQIPAHYRTHKERFLKMNGGYAYPSYGAVLAAHAISPKESPAHPLWKPRA